MAFTTRVKFPHKLNPEEISLTVRQDGVHFVDVLAVLHKHLHCPINNLYITVNSIPWSPPVFYDKSSGIITEDKSEDAVEYSVPYFMPPFLYDSYPLSDLSLSIEELVNLEVGYCTFINLLESNTIKYIIAIPPHVAEKILAGREANKSVWEYNLDLIPGEIDFNRITEWATCLFLDCVVYDNNYNSIPINLSTVNVNNIQETTTDIANLLKLSQLSIEPYLDTPLQHPVVEYFMFKRLGNIAADRLNHKLKNMHDSSIRLNEFFLIYLQLCDRAEASSARPPSWPYRNPLLVKESYFISNSYASDKGHPIHNFKSTYPVVEDITYLNTNCMPYKLCCDQDVLIARLLKWFPLANDLCCDGVLLAGMLPAMIHIEDLYKVTKNYKWVDLFIYGQTATARYKSLEELLKRLEAKSGCYKITYHVLDNIITAKLQDMEIKIIYTNAKTKSEILYNFDSSYIQVGYDNSTFYSTPEFHYFTPRRESLIFRSSIQLHRLMKIIDRGFLPVLDQDHCLILGTRRDLPKIVCNKYTVLNFVRGSFFTGLVDQKEQVRIIQKIEDRKMAGNIIFVENVHFIEKPTNIGPEIHVFHVLSKLSFDDVLLNSYNSYHGYKINRLKIKRNDVYRKMHNNTVKLIKFKDHGSLLVRNFKWTKSEDKDEKRRLVSVLINRALAEIKLYQDALEQGKLLQKGSDEKGYYYTKPNTEQELNRAVYVVRINNVDTHPSKEEIETIIERKSNLLNIKIGSIKFDVRVRIGEKCRAGIKLDGTRIVHLGGKRVNFSQLEDRVMSYLSEETEVDNFLRYGVSLDIPVVGYYIKSGFSDKYIDSDEKTTWGQTDLDPEYNHTAVLKYDDLFCFKLARVTKDVKKSSEIEEEEVIPDDNMCSSDDSETEEDETVPILPTEVKRNTKPNCLDPVKCINLAENTTVKITGSTTEDNRTVLVDKNIEVKSFTADLFPITEKDKDFSSEELTPTKIVLTPIDKDMSSPEEEEEEELSGEDLISS